LENNFLVPRIIGRSLNLHPLVVIIGVIAGANLAGILGIFLAPPILASLRIVGKYVYCKLLDREPFDGLRAHSFPAQESSEEPDQMQEGEDEAGEKGETEEAAEP
jgi:hypothetical protein